MAEGKHSWKSLRGLDKSFQELHNSVPSPFLGGLFVTLIRSGLFKGRDLLFPQHLCLSSCPVPPTPLCPVLKTTPLPCHSCPGPFPGPQLGNEPAALDPASLPGKSRDWIRLIELRGQDSAGGPK